MPREGRKPQIDSALVHELAKLLDETGLTEIEYGTPDWHLRVARGASASAFVTAPQAAAASTVPPPAASAMPAKDEDAAHPGVVASPMVGVAYLKADPESPPFVQIGENVSEGQTIVLIEAMKVFNPIKAPRAGKVTRIFVTNGAPVEYGEPLLIIE